MNRMAEPCEKRCCQVIEYSLFWSSISQWFGTSLRDPLSALVRGRNHYADGFCLLLAKTR